MAPRVEAPSVAAAPAAFCVCVARGEDPTSFSGAGCSPTMAITSRPPPSPRRGLTSLPASRCELCQHPSLSAHRSGPGLFDAWSSSRVRPQSVQTPPPPPPPGRATALWDVRPLGRAQTQPPGVPRRIRHAAVFSAGHPQVRPPTSSVRVHEPTYLRGARGVARDVAARHRRACAHTLAHEELLHESHSSLAGP